MLNSFLQTLSLSLSEQWKLKSFAYYFIGVSFYCWILNAVCMFWILDIRYMNYNFFLTVLGVVFSLLLRNVWWKIEFFRVFLSMIPFFTFIYLKCFNSLCLCCAYLCEVMCVSVGICVPQHTYRGHRTTLGVSPHLVFIIVSCQFCPSKFWAIPCLCLPSHCGCGRIMDTHWYEQLYCVLGIWAQVLTSARQARYPLSHLHSPLLHFCL